MLGGHTFMEIGQIYGNRVIKTTYFTYLPVNQLLVIIQFLCHRFLLTLNIDSLMQKEIYWETTFLKRGKLLEALQGIYWEKKQFFFLKRGKFFQCLRFTRDILGKPFLKRGKFFEDSQARDILGNKLF